jgi:hypothetical protein
MSDDRSTIPRVPLPALILAWIDAFFECAGSRITGKPQFVIKVTLPEGQTRWAAARNAGSAVTLVSRENAAVFRSRFTAAVALSKMTRLPTQFVEARVEQIR